MAISEDLPGVAVTITTGGRELREYDSIELKPLDGTVDCLIAATTNQIFTIKCTADENTEFKGSVLVFTVDVDGQAIDTQSVAKTDATTRIATAQSLGLNETADTLRRYRFTNVESVVRESSSLSSRSPSSTPPSTRSRSTRGTLTPTTQEESAPSSIMSATTATYISDMADLGTIKIKVYHAYVGEEVPFGAKRSVLVPDRMKKLAAEYNALSHYVSFARPERTEVLGYYLPMPVKKRFKPAATFIFHYRSSRMLRSVLGKELGTSEPSPPTTDGISASSLADRLRDLATLQSPAAEQPSSSVSPPSSRTAGHSATPPLSAAARARVRARQATEMAPWMSR